MPSRLALNDNTIPGEQTPKSPDTGVSGDLSVCSAGGVVSGKIMGAAIFKQGSTKVMFEGKPAATLLSMTGQNDAPVSNAPAGSQVVPSQAVVLVAP